MIRSLAHVMEATRVAKFPEAKARGMIESAS